SLFALRAERAKLTSAGEDLDVVEVRPGAGRPTVEIAVEASLERLHGRRCRFVAQRDIRQSQLVGSRDEQGLERGDHFPPRLDELGAQVGDAVGPWPQRFARAVAERDSAE